MWYEPVVRFFAFLQAGVVYVCSLIGLVPNSLCTAPTVFVSENCYQIVWETSQPSTAWVDVGGVTYTDHLAGNIRWDQKTHKVEVPFEALDAAKGYEIHYRHMIAKLAGYPVLQGKEFSKRYAFRPMDPGDGLQIYNISDNHSALSPADTVARYWGDKLDLLILNGDIANNIDSPSALNDVLELAFAVTGGGRPVLYARGNHETRGAYRLEFDRWVGCPGPDRYYFTTRLGPLWIAVFDAGEDKLDGHVEYEGLADFDAYRAKETAYFENVAANAAKEFDAPGVEYRLLVSHIPVGEDKEAYRAAQEKWTALANQMKLDLAISGHWHSLNYYAPGSYNGQAYPLIIGARPIQSTSDGSYTATALEFKDGKITAWFTGIEHQAVREIAVKG